ncbi:MAG: polyprenyl synthetase family protein [Fimbriimonadaceae bacterium]
MAIDSRLTAYQVACGQRLESLLPSASQRPVELHEAMMYSALAPGKRIRPVLCLAVCEALGGTYEPALDVACSLELVHCFSLIHDDLPAIDNDDLRRGRPTCHVKFGEAIAILAGDALFALAFTAISNSIINDAQKARCVAILARASGSRGLVGGEVVDVLTEGRSFTPEDLEFIHSMKTGALIAASCEMGAVCAGCAETGPFSRYGELMGLAFQVADDLLNETSTAAELGKAAGSDRERGKATYPALFGIERSQEHAVELVDQAIAALPSTLRDGILGEIARYAVERRN